MEILGAYGPWGVVGGMVGIVVTAFFRRWIVPWGYLVLVRTQQQEITDLIKDALALERQRSDAIQNDQIKLMRELTEALHDSRPAGT